MGGPRSRFRNSARAAPATLAGSPAVFSTNVKKCGIALQKWQVHMPLGCLSQRVIFPVPHQPDYLNQWTIRPIRSEPLADHAFARPEASRKRLVDHGNLRWALSVALCEFSARKQRRAHGFEIARAHAIEEDHGPASIARVAIAFWPHESIAQIAAAERQHRGRTCGDHAWQESMRRSASMCSATPCSSW